MPSETGPAFRPKPATGELEIRILDESLFEKSPWLREKRFWGSPTKLVERFTKLRIAAVSIRPEERRAGGRVWFLRSRDKSNTPFPVEAVIPSSIARNEQSTPYSVGREATS
jgi:hypothetical protein